jgi:GNAT superfamily N-acetyltransferase
VAIKPLPTGEEPPKGYESVYAVPPLEALRIEVVLVSQLASVEQREVEELRQSAYEQASELIGLADADVTFRQESEFISNISPSNKLMFRAYMNGALVGYSLVIIGLPKAGDWTIQFLVIDPSKRSLGVGSSIVSAIEKYALDSEVDANNIYAIPIRKTGTDFWQTLGYSERSDVPIDISVNHDLVFYRKVL